jgi:hypothetical protein
MPSLASKVSESGLARDAFRVSDIGRFLSFFNI